MSLPIGVEQAAPAIVAQLSGPERVRWAHHVQHLLDRVGWETARDVELTDDMRYTVAAHGAVLAAGMEAEAHPFHNVRSIVMHEGTIRTAQRRFIGRRRGVVHGGTRAASGLSSPGHGPLVLDWRTVRVNVAHPERGMNVVYHEFAHKLDQLTGQADGMPPLPSREHEAAWLQTLGVNFRRLRRRGSDGLIRNYGATNEGEYFAVCTEVFLTRPVELRDRLPRVYDRLATFYRLDPAQAADHCAAMRNPMMSATASATLPAT